MKKAIQFGAGNIGRGFLGQLFYESGYETTFVDVVDELVEALNARRGYPLRIVDETANVVHIAHASAVHGKDREAVATAVAEADLGATAVGVNVLSRIAPTLAAGIAKRFETRHDAGPLNFIVCENLLEAGPFLREEVRKYLDGRWHEQMDAQIGFVEASIGRMVPIMTEAMREGDPLTIWVEPYCELPVDREGFRGAIPELKHMLPRDNFQAYVERKLFVHNAGHAATAYVGYLRGHEYIWQAISDPRVRAEVEAALTESCAGLIRRHPLDPEELAAHKDDLIYRFHNQSLGDQVARVAKDPVRKLGARDRLIGAGLMCIENGIVPEHLAFAAAAAIRYDHPSDEAAQKVQRLYRTRGLEGVLEEICGIGTHTPLAALIRQGIERIRTENWINETSPSV